MRIQWKPVFEAIRDALESFEQQEVKPTLRTLFYRLVSQQKLPNTAPYYRQLSSRLVRARKQGLFKWDCIVDNIRATIGGLYDAYPDEQQVEGIKDVL
jgi:hypothetical protein